MMDSENTKSTSGLKIISDDELRKILEEHEKCLESQGEESEFADLSFTDLSNNDLTGFNLNFLNLEGSYLHKAHLEGADLFGAHLERTNLSGAHLEGAELCEAHLEGADLLGAHLERADLFGARLEGVRLRFIHLEEARLSEAHLEGADLFSAHLEGANLTNVNLENANVSGVTYNRKGKFRGIRVGNCYGSPMFKRFAQDQDFIEELQQRSWWGKPLYSLWNILADCGRTPWRWIIWSIIFAFYFGLNFYIMATTENAFKIVEGGLPQTFSTYLYYSVVTFTTLGFGDIVPQTSKAAWWVMAEVILGYIMLGGLISILATKLARRS